MTAATREEAPHKGGPDAEKTGHGTPSPPYPIEAPPRTCSACGTTEGRITPTYWAGPLCRECGDLATETFEREGWPRPWWEAPEAPHVAVMGGRGPLTCRTLSVASLGPWCEARGFTQVWVHESAFGALAFPEEGGAPHRFLEDREPFTTGGKARVPVLSGISKWWRPKGFGFTLHIPAYENDSPFAGAESPEQLRCWVAWYERATRRGAPWMGGGAITSDVWIRQTFRSRRRVDLAPSTLPPPMGRAREARWHWSRPAAPAERHFRYCHALDLNLAYAAVASSLQLPVGECEHLGDWPTFDKRVPGLWQIEPDTTAAGLGRYGDPGLPAPWADDARRSSPGPFWVTTPTMERCADYGLEPIDAWIWPEHHAYLRPWYELIRDARTELLDVGSAPLAAVKQLARRGVGRLASPNRSRDAASDPLYQPYWAWAVIAECRARLHRRLAALEVAPVAIDTDAVYFLSSRSSPGAFAAAVGLPLGEGLGQFKAAGTCAAAPARAALEVGGHGGRGVLALRELMKGAA